MKKSILITGCSSGIGLAAAKILHEKGYQVFATARKPADLATLSALGVQSISLDLTDSNSIQQAVKEVLAKTGGTLDALFNNAGYIEVGAVEDLSRDQIRQQFETNVFGTVELTNLVIPVMRKQGHGRIIQNTSILGIVAMPYRGAYNASKFALEGFTHTLRQELSGTGIFVAIIAPGPIESSLRNKALAHYQKDLKQKSSVHRKAYESMEKEFFLSSGKKNFAASADQVIKKLLLALESTHPKVHYYVPFSAQVFAWLRRLLPEKLLDAIMIKINRGELKND